MRIRHVGVAAAMAIFAGTVISGPGPAQAQQIAYEHSCSFGLAAPGQPESYPVNVDIQFTTSTSGASVLAKQILVENRSDHEIILDINRWQSDNGTQLYRGPGDDIPGLSSQNQYPGLSIWYPTSWISFANNPYVVVHAYAKSRPAMTGGVICLARPVPGS